MNKIENQSLLVAREALQKIKKRNDLTRKAVIAGQIAYIPEMLAHSEGLHGDTKELIIRIGFISTLTVAGLIAHRNYRESDLGIKAIDVGLSSPSTSTPQTADQR